MTKNCKSEICFIITPRTNFFNCRRAINCQRKCECEKSQDSMWTQTASSRIEPDSKFRVRIVTEANDLQWFRDMWIEPLASHWQQVPTNCQPCGALLLGCCLKTKNPWPPAYWAGALPTKLKRLAMFTRLLCLWFFAWPLLSLPAHHKNESYACIMFVNQVGVTLRPFAVVLPDRERETEATCQQNLLAPSRSENRFRKQKVRFKRRRFQ